MSTELIVQRGARYVEQDELRSLATPPATTTWFPIAHGTVLDRVIETLGHAGFSMRSMSLAVSQDNARFFATLDLEANVAQGISLAIGIRNSVDKSLPLGFIAGHRVLVCSNLAFRSDLVNITRRHTRFGEVRYQEAISKAVQSLEAFQQAEAERICRLEQTQITSERAESLMLRAYEDGIVSHFLLPKVIQEWRQPAFEQFQDRTLWSIFNAFTTVLAPVARSNPQRFASLTMRLHDLLDH